MSNRRDFLKIKNVEQLKKKIETDIQKIVYRNQTTEGVAEIVVDGIRNGKKYSAKETTKKIRAQLERLNRTHKDYQRSKINFTFTGDLLKDLIKNVKKVRSGKSKTQMFISHSNKKHRAYKVPGAKKKRSGKGVKQLSHSSIYENLVKLDSKYAYLRRKISSGTSKKIVRFLKSSIINFYNKR